MPGHALARTPTMSSARLSGPWDYPDRSSAPKARWAVGVSRYAHWCEARSSGSWFKPMRSTSSGDQRQHLHQTRRTTAAPLSDAGRTVAFSGSSCPTGDHRSRPAGFFTAAAQPRSRGRRRPCKVMDARPVHREICRHDGDCPPVPTQRSPCAASSAMRLPCAGHHRGHSRRPPTPIHDRQTASSRHSLCLG